MDARVQSILDEIINPEDTEITASHNKWMQRELVKLLHKEMDVARNEQNLSNRMDRERKKSKLVINHASDATSKTPKNC
tara:strand:- start:2305 stop:2541 length:237 start_codon:yes stop_codon:yes gene_type:complete